MVSEALPLALLAFLGFLVIAFEEIPVGFNVARVARRVRRTARRRGRPETVVLSSLRRQTQAGSVVLLTFAALCAVFAAMMSTRPGATADFLLIAAGLVLGLLVLSVAFLFLAPRLFERVEEHLARESATPNSLASDAEPVHGPRP